MVVAVLGLCCLLCIWLGVVCRLMLVCRRVLANPTVCSVLGMFRCVIEMCVL